MFPRRFALVRHVDYTGVSGVGVVAYGVMFEGGQVALRTCSAHPSLSVWDSLDDLVTVYGGRGATAVEWIDEEHDDTAVHEAVSRHQASVTALHSKSNADTPTVPITASADTSSARPLPTVVDGDFPQPPIRPEPVEPEPVPVEPPVPPQPPDPQPHPEPPVHPEPVKPEPIPPGRPSPAEPEPPQPEPQPEPAHSEPASPEPEPEPEQELRHSAGRHRRRGPVSSDPIPLTPNEVR